MNERAQIGPASKSKMPDPLIGRTINDRFHITGLIARGGMGKVYRAEQTPLGRKCAIKVLDPSYTGEQDPEFHKRFFLEASIASKLTHPNTVTIFDYGRTEDDIYFMAMELLEGLTLHRAIRTSAPFAEERALHVARQVCRALREAHAHGVIHRDLKPANIFLVEHGDEKDFVKVLDFGLVKNVNERAEELTQTGLFMGSPKYMAPEQIQGEHVDARTDIYSLGVILYEMVTGKVPFDRQSSVNTLMAHVRDPVPPLRSMNPKLDISPLLEDAILRCLEKNIEKRFASMDDLLQRLKVCSSSRTMRAAPGADSSASVPPVSGSMPVRGGPLGTDPPALTRPPRPPLLPSDVPVVSLPPEPAPRRPVTKGIAAIAGFALVAAGAVLTFARTHSTPTPASSAPTATATNGTPSAVPAATAEAPATPTAVTLPLLVKLRVTTEPDGASVRENGVELCSITPCDVLFEGPEAEASRVHTLVVSRPGFRAEQRTVKIGEGPVFVRLARAPSVRNAPSPAKEETPKGFKEIPY